MPLTLNWFGMAVKDVPAATDFYGSKLGISFEENAALGNWRYFQTRCMTFELFEAYPDHIKVNAWGDGQAYRPVILVSDLSKAAAMLREKEIPYREEIFDLGPQLEMTGSENIRWGILESKDVETDWAHPLIAGIELKASNLEDQKKFYTQILGMAIEQETEDFIHLIQKDGDAWLHIVTGGRPASLSAAPDSDQAAFHHTIWISFETQDMQTANAWLTHQNVHMIHPLIYHPDWNGTDILLADPDGNVVQVVQYGNANTDKSA